MITGNNYYVSIFQTFLSDYGMVWIGEKSDPKSDVYNDEDISDSDSSEDLWRPGLNTFLISALSSIFNNFIFRDNSNIYLLPLHFKWQFLKILHACLITLFF